MTAGHISLSVRTPLIIWISLILVAGFLTTNLISYFVSKQSLRSALIDNELPLTSNNIYSEIQRDLLQPVFVSSLMANDTFVKDWLSEGEVGADRVVRYLDEIRRQYGFFTSFLVSEKTHNYYHFSGIAQVVDKADPDDAWYFRVRDMQTPHEINVDPDAAQDNVLTIFINHKVLDNDGNFLAATGVGLKFNAVSDVVARYRDHFGRNVYFINGSGEVMVRSAGALVTEDNIYDAPGMGDIADTMMAADFGFFEYERNGETMLVSTRFIPELHWLVVVEQRESDALAGIRKSLLTNTVVGLFVIALTLIIVIFTLNKFHARLENMAITDKLTGIGNRSVFDISLSQALKRQVRDAKPFCVLLADIDHFKQVNDTLGHLEGDEVIKRIVNFFSEGVRETDLLCRWGGEELIVLAYDCQVSNAVQMAEKIRANIEAAAIVHLPDGGPVTISFGVAEVQSGDDADTILRRADDALYQAKKNGRNRVCQA